MGSDVFIVYAQSPTFNQNINQTNFTSYLAVICSYNMTYMSTGP